MYELVSLRVAQNAEIIPAYCLWDNFMLGVEEQTCSSASCRQYQLKCSTFHCKMKPSKKG